MRRVGITRAQICFQPLPLSSEIYAALGAIDEEIYTLRLRFVPGPAKAFALTLRRLTLSLPGRLERPFSKHNKRIRCLFDRCLVPVQLAGYVLVLQPVADRASVRTRSNPLACSRPDLRLRLDSCRRNSLYISPKVQNYLSLSSAPC